MNCRSQPGMKIEQAIFLADPNISTSRFEHSLGVCHLIKILNGSQKEQIAGLLHDIPHTAFSHVIDYVLENKGENFHEKHKLRFLLNRELSVDPVVIENMRHIIKKNRTFALVFSKLKIF